MATRVYIDVVGKNSLDAVSSLLKGIEAARIGIPAATSSFQFDHPPTFPGGNPVIVRKPTHTIDSDEPVKILFIASQRGTGLNLRGQGRAIDTAMHGGIKKRRVMLDPRYDVMAEDLAETINEARPQIVHFSGKQNGQRILVPTSAGGVTTISAMALTGLFLNLAETVRLVIVDTCRSLPSALELCTTVDFAIGVKGDVYDDDATRFYKQFYGALGKGLSLKKAVGQASAALEMRSIKKNEIPVLCCRDGANASAYHIIAPT